MPTNKQIAAYLGVTRQTVDRYSDKKRAEIVRDMEAGANPEVKRLIGELAALCYVVQCKSGESCHVEAWTSYFEVWHDCEYIIKDEPLNAIALQGAIAKLEAML